MSKLLTIINKLLEILVVFNIAAMTCLIFLNVVLRYGFNSGLTVTEELSRFMFVWLSFLGAVLALENDEHVTVNFLVKKLPMAIHAYLSVITDAVLLICCSMLLWGCVTLTLQNMSNYSPITGIPTGVNFLAATIMSIMFVVVLLIRLLVKTVAICKGDIQ